MQDKIKISALVLAAGMSKRMMTLKQLLPYKDSNMLNNILDEIKKSSIDQITLVLGYKHKEIQNSLNLAGIKVVINERYADAMLYSVIIGLRTLVETCDAVMIVLGDQPLISHQLIENMLDSYKINNCRLLVPQYKEIAGHPVIINTCYCNEIYTLNPNLGLKSLFEKYNQDIYHHKVNTNSILLDIDTPNDYQNLINRKN